MIVEELKNFYNKKYGSNVSTDVICVKCRNFPFDRYEAAVHWAGKGSSLLEIGCGSGNVLLALSSSFKECIGVEFSEVRAGELSKLFESNPRVKILTGNVEDKELDFPESYFDAILLNSVLEHLVEPISALKYLYKLLKPGGRIVIITPNIAKWTRRIKLLFGRFPSTASLNEGLLNYDRKTQTKLYDESHLHYFTFRSLKNILTERIGFSKIFCYGFGRPEVLVRLLPRLFSECLMIGIK
ncbi:MAG: class I SAM-dependent methyltransferase [Candidatus Omnitrophota bacterium]|jgi:ubiquinone/menaquinone biosynthesis C-methylase UbiE